MAKRRKKEKARPLLEAAWERSWEITCSLDADALAALGPSDQPSREDRLGVLVSHFDGQMLGNAAMFWIVNEWHRQDAVLSNDLRAVKSVAARKVRALLARIDRIAARAAVLESLPESRATTAKLDRLAVRCADIDDAYAALRESFLDDVEAHLAAQSAPS